MAMPIPTSITSLFSEISMIFRLPKSLLPVEIMAKTGIPLVAWKCLQLKAVNGIKISALQCNIWLPASLLLPQRVQWFCLDSRTPYYSLHSTVKHCTYISFFFHHHCICYCYLHFAIANIIY